MYTLADNETNKARQNHVIVNGEGSDLRKTDALQGRAKRKTITQSMMLNLIDLAKEEDTPELQKAFWNTYHCQQKIITAEGKLYGKYCKNRFCSLCCSIRKTEIINRYYPIIKQWEEPHFVTITIKAVKEEKLKSRIDAMIRGFRRINAKHRKRHQRGTGIKLVGVKSLECNFNPKKKTYNPHLHIITANKEMAEVIIDDWLKLCTPEFANRKGQKIEKTFDVEKNLIEVIKYGTKIFTEPDLKKRAKETTTAQIYIKALNNILVAMKGKRIFERFGFDIPKEQTTKKIPAKLLSSFNEWQYNSKSCDWENIKTGELLTGFIIPSHLQALLENNVNSDLK
ncbi:protein rep [Thalassobellus suaedae]|uniref:Protein rep n=1 Tax=Thalassobellus suaedae TaxID=3074124 RepID=A0ABY9XXW8_9FLAO|nr:protein rep [Flavobacteriaceae bacterium HL-DH14]